MDNEVRALRLDNNLPAKEIVSVVRGLYPKFDKPLLSKCEHGDLYGVDLRPDALAALKEYAGARAAPEGKKRPKAERRRKVGRCYVRLEESAYTALQRAIKADGYATMQGWFEETVKKYLAGREEP